MVLPVIEDFDGYGTRMLPDCWYATRNYDLGAAPHLSTSRHYNGSSSLYLYSGSIAESHYSMVIAPELEVEGFEHVFMTFQFYAATTATRLEVGICEDTSRYTRHFTPVDTFHVDRPNRWQEVVVDLGAYSGTGRRVAFRLQRGLQVENSECYIDDLRIGSCGTTVPWVNHLGSTRLTLNWERYGEGSISVRYNGITIPDAQSPLTLTGLQPSTAYTFSIGCDEGQRHTLSVTTMDGAGMVPAYYESFVGSAMPLGWRTPLDNVPQVSEGTLWMQPSVGDSCLAVLPLQVTVDTRQLSMAFRMSGGSSTRLVVGVMDYPDEMESFVPVDTLIVIGRMDKKTVRFDGYTGEGGYIALLALGSGTIKVDDLRVAQCLIDNVRLYGLTSEEVTVAWDTLVLPEGGEVKIEWGMSGFAFGTGTEVVANTNPFTLTGLTPSTHYDLYIHPGCGDSICSYDKHQVTTFSHEVTAPYCCSFEDGNALPQGWVCPIGGVENSASSYQGGGSLRLMEGSVVTLPQVTNIAGTLLFEFYGSGTGTLEIGLMQNPYSDFTPVMSVQGNNSWQRFVNAMDIPSGQVLALRNTGVWYIDALALHGEAVGDISVEAITQTSARLMWTMIGGDSVSGEYARVGSSTSDFSPGDGIPFSTRDSITIMGLAPGSNYAVHLRPLSDTAGGECHYLTTHFQTAADNIELPYCENFDGSASYPVSWRRTSEYGEYPIVTTERNRSQSRSMRFSATAGQRTVALLPNTLGLSTHKTLAFWSSCTLQPQGTRLLVGRLADISDINSFVPTDTILFPSANTWRHSLIDLGENDSNVALMLVGGSSEESRVFIDDLCMESCVAFQVRLSRVDSTTATFTWRGAGVEGVEIQVSGSGLSRRDTFYTSPGVVRGLQENLTYSFTVRTLCECGDRGGTYYSGTTGRTSTDRSYSFSIRTHSGVVAVPYCTGFENIITGNGPGSWRRSGGSYQVSDQNYYNGSRSLQVNNACITMLPTMNNIGNLMVSFQIYAMNETALAEGAVQVGVVRTPDSAAATFIPIDTVNITRPGRWYRHATDLSVCPSDYHYIAIRHLASGTLYIDDVNVSPCGIDSASVDETGLLTWRGIHSPDGVLIEYGPKGFTRGNGFLDTARVSPFQMSGLTVGQNYDIYLTSFRGSQRECSATKITFGNVMAIPYCENFDVAPPAGMPADWLVGRTFSATPALVTNGSNRYLTLNGHASSINRSIVVLPMLATGDSLQLSFSMRTPLSGNARLIVGHIEATADPNTFDPVDTLMNTRDNTWQRFALPLSLQAGRKVALCCYSTSQEVSLEIDTLSVTHGRTPQIDAVGARSIRLVSDRDDYYVEYGARGFIQGNGTVLHITSDTFTVAGLQPQANYWFYIREDAATITCMPPVGVTMPAEESLPYCRGAVTFSRLQLPEFGIDSVNRLHLYISLRGGSMVEVGVMDYDGGWEGFVPVDTLSLPSGTLEKIHIDMNRYAGSGRFVAFRTIGAGNTVVDDMTVTVCALVTATLRDDNSVILRGNSIVEYGEERFVRGSGTEVVVNDSLVISGLSDNTTYDYYSYCSSSDNLCYSSSQWHTSTAVSVPYCAEFANDIPDGWTTFSNAVSANALRVEDGCLAMTVNNSSQVGATMPLMSSHNVYVYLDVYHSSSSVALVIGDDTIRASSAGWQTIQVHVEYEGRLMLQAIGGGTVKLRRIEIDECPLPNTMVIGQPGGGVVELDWDINEAPNPFFIEYKMKGDANAGTTVRAIAPPLELQLMSDTVYYLYLKCDSSAATCRQPIEVATPEPQQALPYCSSFDFVQFKVLPQFDVESLNPLNVTFYAHFNISSSHTITLGVMSNANDPSSFDSLTSFSSVGTHSTRCFYSFANYYGNGTFLAFRVNNSDRLYIDSLSVSTCAAYNFRLEESENGHVVIGWEQRGTPEVSITYRPIDSTEASNRVLNPTASPCRIEGLEALTDYIFCISASCDNASCLSPETDTFYTFTPKGGTGCIDYTDLRATYITCHYGSYSNPSQFTGVVDYGYNNAASRHTVHFDTTERDPRTGGLLRTVPMGELASVRLGNWITGVNGQAQAESIIYGMTVDSTQADLLVLKYAAVLQDPEHSASLQPRFRLEILNQNYELIDSCGLADFIAHPDLNWNLAPNDVLWKDWTTVGMDISSYSGQTIFIRLTTYDCGEGSHFGYAYFTLECATKRMKVEGCSDVPDNCFTVPSGFNYRWFSNQSPLTISDSSTLCIASDNSLTYYCDISFVDNPSCNFMMSAFAGARYPLAIFDTSLVLSNCEFDLSLNDNSTISGDGITPVGTGERCETTLWLLPDGTTYDGLSTSLHITDTGIYHITLVAGIANNQCLDTLSRDIHITYPYPAATLSGRSDRCYNDPADMLTISHALSSQWENDNLSILPLADTLVSVQTVDTNGCRDTLHHLLKVHPIYLIPDKDTVCASDLSFQWRDTVFAFTFDDSFISATLRRQTATYGCDSVMTLELLLQESYDIHHRDTICDNQSFAFFDTVLVTTGSYLHDSTTLQGCDSLVTMHLMVHPTYHTDDPRRVCDSLRWQDGNLYLADTIGPLDSLLSIHRCDSVITLKLSVFPSYYITDLDTVCSSNLHYSWRDTTLTFTPNDTEVAATLYRNTVAQGCDSTMTIRLNLWPSYYPVHYDTLCHDSQRSFFDTLLTTTGTYLHVDSTTHRCDSLVTLHLNIIPRTFHDDRRTVCDSLVWVNGVTYYRNINGVVDTLPTSRFGCDSVVTLYLNVNYSTKEMAVDTFCQGKQYYFRDFVITEGGYYADTLSTSEGCDSVLGIDLYRRPSPRISINSVYDCESDTYTITGTSDMPFNYWSTNPFDSAYYDTDFQSILVVAPQVTTSYILSAAYTADSICYTSDTLTVRAATSPIARLQVYPQALVYPDRSFTSYDNSGDFLVRAWYVDGVLQEETSRYLFVTAGEEVDTTEITLIIGDDRCFDTASAQVLVLHEHVAYPNAFTPDATDNNTFSIAGRGIIDGELCIYNRYGMLVFKSSDINEAWDGRDLNGNPCPTGSYVWNLRYHSQVHPVGYAQEHGTVLLIR